MPLTWDARECDLDFDDEDEAVITQTIVFLTMPVAIGHIKESNWKDFWTRVYILQKLHGAFMYRDGDNYFLTPKDIHRRIGLRTNVGSPETNSQWRKRIFESIDKDQKWACRDQIITSGK